MPVKLYLGTIFIALNFFSCQVPSRVALSGDGGRNSYNQTLQQTNNEQMLLNLVRLRHVDFPYFLDVTNITTQTTVGSSLSPSVSIPWTNQYVPSALGGEFSWQNQPTIVYSPLEGQAFAERLFQPIPLPMIQRLIYSGWEIDRVLRIMLQSLDGIENAPSASGPAPEIAPDFTKFNRMASLLRVLQREGELALGIKQEGEEKYLQVSFPIGYAEADELKSLLAEGEERDGRYYIFIKQGLDSKGDIGVMPRSLLGCMYYLSLGVDVPDKDCIPMTKKRDGACFDWREMIGDLITVHSSRKQPQNAAVMVKYRGFWYYIKEEDMSSKRTFCLLMQLYNFHATNTGNQSGPVLTLPIGTK